MIDEKQGSQVILLSGDRHGARGFAIPRPNGKPIYEFEAGTLGAVKGPGAYGPGKKDQLCGYVGLKVWAFGEFTFGVEDGRSRVTFRLIDEQGAELKSIPLP